MRTLLATVDEWYRNRRIRSKILLVYFPLLIVPLIVIGYAANAIYSKAIVDRTTKAFSENAALLISRLDGMLTNAESCANMLALNLNRVLDAYPEPAPGPVDLPRYNAVTTQLSLALVVFPDVDSIVFIDSAGRLFGTAPALERSPTKAVASEEYAAIAATNGVNRWLDMERRDYLTPDAGEAVLTLGKKIVDIQSGNTLGQLFLNVRESRLSGVLRSMNAVRSSRYFIADERGEVVSSAERAELLLPIGGTELREWVANHRSVSQITEVDGADRLLATRDFPRLGWKLVSVTPLRSLTEGLEQLRNTLLAIALICSLFALFGAVFLSKRIAGPIVELARSMKGFQEGDLNVRLEVGSRDELGLFAAGFNEMTRRLRELVARVKREQRKKREYELALIHSQMKPHFLYNTLDVIYALAQMGRYKDVQRATKSLADFYRAALSRGRDRITVEEELRNVRDYLAIQHIRYEDVFTYEIAVDPAIGKAQIPKLTIQPLIENAIYHGLKEKLAYGKLTVEGRREGGSIVIRVRDNGVGMDPDKVRRLLLPAEAAADAAGGGAAAGGSYAVRSVNDRIKLTFGRSYGLHIESEPGVGTTVTVTLPADPYFREEPEDESDDSGR